VEAVEALTIVLAAGLTRGWRWALAGVGSAVLVLAALVAVLGPALTVIPLDALRVVVGALLLAFGMQWLRKAILRAAGVKSVHDEAAIFERESAAARAAASATAGFDGYAFTLAFKGVVLEGLEVVFIVLGFGASTHHTLTAAIGAAAAVLVVAGAGLALHRPLARVPENTTKFVVGIMLTSFGTFWAAEGVGVRWPGSDAALIGLIAGYVAVSMATVTAVRRATDRPLAGLPL
jgi:uncharacterized membrane protein